MSSLNPNPTPRRRVWPTVLVTVVIVALVAAVIWLIPKGTNNGDATPQPTQSTATPQPGVTTYSDPADADSEEDEWVDESGAFAQWTYPGRYVKIATDAGFGKDTINDQDIPIMMMGTLPDDNNTIDLTIWPDSAGPALTYKSASGVVLQTIVYADACAAYAFGMQNTPLFAEHHTWLKAHFPTDSKKINDWAAKAVNGTDEEKLEAAKSCAIVASFWEDWTDLGVLNNITTSFNIHAMDRRFNPSAPFTTAPEFEINPDQYTGEFEAFADVEKGEPWECEDVVLVNTGDGRFALPDCTVVVVTPGCTGSCGAWVCPYPLNADGQCIPPKTVDYTQSYPGGKPAAQDDGLDKKKPEVITIIEDDDSTDESAESDGVVTDE